MPRVTLRQARAKLRARIRDATGEFSGRFAERVIDRTPVREGWAKGGWVAKRNTAVGQLPTEASGIRDPSGTGTKVRAWQVAGQMQMGDTFNLLNGVPYIRRLEHGHSRQAPRGMVRVTIAEARQIAAEAAAKVRRQRGYRAGNRLIQPPDFPGWSPNG